MGLRELFVVLALVAATTTTERLQVLYLLGAHLYHLSAGLRHGWQAMRLWGLLLQVKGSALWETRVAMEVRFGGELPG